MSHTPNKPYNSIVVGYSRHSEFASLQFCFNSDGNFVLKAERSGWLTLGAVTGVKCVSKKLQKGGNGTLQWRGQVFTVTTCKINQSVLLTF